MLAYTAAGMYAGAAIVGLVEVAIPGGETFTLIPGFTALAFTLLLVAVGPRLSRVALAPLGPLGAVMIGAALADTRGYTDGAVLYMWPALWTAYFYGRRGTAFIVIWIGVVHALALIAMPPGHASVDRWLDVEVAVIVVAAVVRSLARHNEQLVKQLSSDARIDPLTGLLNRRGFDERMRIELARMVRDHSMLAVVTFDIDNFKAINDEHGHEVGDRVLTWIGSVLRDQLRTPDIAARFGGEEFVLALPQTDAEPALAVADRVRRLIAADGYHASRAQFGVPEELHVTVSGGVAAGDASVDLDNLVYAADQAMYHAKRGGRNRVVAGRDASTVPR